LLKALELKGALVTIDAAGCQGDTARPIRAKQGHYLLAVKGNQPGLHEAVAAVFDRACAADFAGVRSDTAAQVEDAHRRQEERYVTVIYDPEGLPPEWIENGRHWVLDVTFREGANRTGLRNAGANLGLVRRIAASLLKQAPGRGSIKGKRLRAALDARSRRGCG
jgi:predicted transposase YbfD/YdcC